MPMNVRVKGARETFNALMALSAATRANALEEAIMPAALAVLADAKARAPVGSRRRPGRKMTLRESLNILVTRKEGHIVTISIGTHKDVFYGMFVEYGTKQREARPFLRPALDGNKNAVRQQVLQHLEATAKQVTGHG